MSSDIVNSPLAKIATAMALEHSLGMTEKKLKFLIYSGQQFFGTQEIAMTFDATKIPPTIVITPEKESKYFSREEWKEFDKKFGFDKTCRNLESYLGVSSNVKIMFRRVVPKVKA
jgi:hypothetical protein